MLEKYGTPKIRLGSFLQLMSEQEYIILIDQDSSGQIFRGTISDLDSWVNDDHPEVLDRVVFKVVRMEKEIIISLNRWKEHSNVVINYDCRMINQEDPGTIITLETLLSRLPPKMDLSIYIGSPNGSPISVLKNGKVFKLLSDLEVRARYLNRPVLNIIGDEQRMVVTILIH